jgi:hypothetical protein
MPDCGMRANVQLRTNPCPMHGPQMAFMLRTATEEFRTSATQRSQPALPPSLGHPQQVSGEG